jgi:hypothetical protein
MDLLSQSCTTQGFAAYNAFQTKGRNYCDWHPTNQFLPLPVEVFGCLHKHANAFLHNCANTIWSLKGPEGSLLFVLVIFLWQKKSITLQRLQTSSILSQVVAISLVITRLPPLQRHISHLHDQLIASDQFLIWKNTTDLLQAVDFWHG